ncbi:hypothetical protein HY989_05285 [Candidatus Micrarchaeota archaeon]|nr:hypothetical protein [Candidatus Micrarchaeota archaeon]
MKNSPKTGKLENIRKFLKAAGPSHQIRSERPLDNAVNNLKELARIDSDFARKRLVNILFDEPLLPYYASDAILASNPNKFVPHLKRRLEKTKYYNWGIPKNIYENGGIVKAIHILGEIGTKEALMALVDLAKIRHPYISRKIKNAGQNAWIKFQEKRNPQDPPSTIEFSFRHIDPFEYPKSFAKFHEEVKRKPNKPEEYWNLTAKQLMAMEGRLK